MLLVTSSNFVIIFLAALLAHFVIMASSEKKCDDEPAVYKDVKDGCKLLNCTGGTFCGIRKGIAKFGERPFETFLFPKCVKNVSELNQNTDPDGNSHIETDGPGCNLVQCSQGYECQVRISISKLGNLPYSQSINGFPQCVNASSPSFESANSVIVGGPGCDKLGPCPSGSQCTVAEGIAKYGSLSWSQFFWPFCA